MFAAAFISYVLRYNVSLAGPTLIEDLGLTEQQFGYVLAAFGAGYALFQFPGGVFTDTVGPRRALAIITVLWAALTVLTMLVPGSVAGSVGVTLVLLIVIRFLVGSLHAPIFPLVGAVIERWFPVGRWAVPNAITSVGLTLGAAAAAAMLPALIADWGWRNAFLATSPLGLLIAGIWWWYARDHPGEHESVNALEVELIAANRPPIEAASGEAPAWLRVLKNRNVLLLTLAYFSSNYIFYLFFSWVPYYLETVRGFDAEAAGVISAAQWLAGGAGALAGGFLCDALTRRYGLRRGCAWPAAAAILVAGALLGVGAVSTNPDVAVRALAGAFLFQQMTEGAFWAAAIGIGRHHAAAACGVLNTGGNLVGTVSAPLVPMVAGSFGWPAAIMTGSLFALICAGLWVFIRADRPISD